MALCKGYCAINILVLPKQFDNGGWIIGIVAISTAAVFVLMSGLKLLKCGQVAGIYTYPGIAQKALGTKGKIVVDIFLSFCQFSFTVA
jgi:amino acid permease